jgi:hypothetical protein
VYDLYEESLDEYRKTMARIRDSLTNMPIPQSEWPAGLLSARSESDMNKAHSASETAFEALERALAAKSLTAAK